MLRLRFLLVLVLLPLVAGCATGIRGFDFQRVDTFPDDFPNPYRNGELPTGFWDDVDALPRGPLARETYAAWPLPFVVQKYRLDVDPRRERATERRYSMITLGLPEAYIPLFFDTEARVWDRSRLAPIAEAERGYNLLWSWGSNDGREDLPGVPNFDVGGIPLFWDTGTESGPKWHFDDYERTTATTFDIEYTNLFSWLGPMWTENTTVEPGPLGETTTRAKVVTPAFLGKGPGLLVWSDYYIEQTKPDGTITERFGHGPVGGYATYHEWRREEPTGRTSKLQLILGGLLWFDSHEERPGEVGPRSNTGPLWAMFGKSQRPDGETLRKRVNFFWFPITYSVEER